MAKQNAVAQAKQNLDGLTAQYTETEREIARLESKFAAVDSIDLDDAYSQLAGDGDRLSAARAVKRSLGARIRVAESELLAAEVAQAQIDFYAHKSAQLAKVRDAITAIDAAVTALHDSHADHDAAAVARQIWKQNAANHYDPWANMASRLEADRIKMAEWVKQTDQQ